MQTAIQSVTFPRFDAPERLVTTRIDVYGAVVLAPPPQPTGIDLPEIPSRATIVFVMRRVAAEVGRCPQSRASTVSLRITVANDGSVSQVDARAVDEPVARCIEALVREQRFGRFRQPTFTINYPMRLTPQRF